jgi:hypothetical protein
MQLRMKTSSIHFSSFIFDHNGGAIRLSLIGPVPLKV